MPETQSRAADGFNLVDERWLSVVMLDGTPAETSLRGVFRDAHQIKELSGELPTVATACFRLLVAIVHSALDGPRDERDWDKLWEAGRAPDGVLDDYLDRWRHRFDLFDPVVPFYQVAGLCKPPRKVQRKGGTVLVEQAPTPISDILPDVPTDRPLFSARHGAALDRMSAAEAARWLVHVHAFDTGGTKSGAEGTRFAGGPGKGTVAWAGQIGPLTVVGDDLWQTLLLNCVPADRPALLRHGKGDRPSWEAEPCTPEAPAETPAGRPLGPRDVLTWQGRRVLLKGDRDGVTSALVCYGDPLSFQDRHDVEPMTAWRREKPRSKSGWESSPWVPVRHEPGVSLWRGAGSLLALRTVRGKDDTSCTLSAPVVEWVADRLEGRHKVCVRATGMAYRRGQPSVIEDVVDDDVWFDTTVLANPAVRSTVVAAVDTTDRGVGALRGFVRRIAEASGLTGSQASVRQRRQKAVDAAADDAYSRLDGAFRHWLAMLDDATDHATALGAWQQTARKVVLEVALETLQRSSDSAWTGRKDATTPGESWGLLEASLSTHLPQAEVACATDYGPAGEWVARTVGQLQARYRRGDGSAAAGLSDLCRHATRTPERVPALLGVVAAREAERLTAPQRAAALSALTLWAVHQRSVRDTGMHTRSVPFGTALGRLRRYKGAGCAAVERRHLDLVRQRSLGSFSRDALSLVRQMREARIGLDYAALADDLAGLPDPRLSLVVRLGWDRDFWAVGRRNGRADATQGRDASGVGA